MTLLRPGVHFGVSDHGIYGLKPAELAAQLKSEGFNVQEIIDSGKGSIRIILEESTPEHEAPAILIDALRSRVDEILNRAEELKIQGEIEDLESQIDGLRERVASAPSRTFEDINVFDLEMGNVYGHLENATYKRLLNLSEDPDNPITILWNRWQVCNRAFQGICDSWRRLMQ